MKNILIIEDEAPMGTALADLLLAEGYRVLTAADGALGLERALAEKPDLIPLDVMMPRLDGLGLESCHGATPFLRSVHVPNDP